MKVMCIDIASRKSNLAFKQNDGFDVYGLDDEVSQQRRNYIREHYNSWAMPYQNIYNNGPKMSEFEINKLISEYSKKTTVTIDEQDMFALSCYNIKNVSSSKKYQPNIYRGRTLYTASDECLDVVKKSGIKTIIDLVGYGKEYKNRIEKNNLSYLFFPVEEYYYSDFVFDRYSKEYIDTFIDFIKKVQEGNVHISCEYGTYKTDHAIMLNKIFNPKLKAEFCRTTDETKPTNLMNLFEALTKESKLLLGWDGEFEKRTYKIIKEMQKMSL